MKNFIFAAFGVQKWQMFNLISAPNMFKKCLFGESFLLVIYYMKLGRNDGIIKISFICAQQGNLLR